MIPPDNIRDDREKLPGSARNECFKGLQVCLGLEVLQKLRLRLQKQKLDT